MVCSFFVCPCFAVVLLVGGESILTSRKICTTLLRSSGARRGGGEIAVGGCLVVGGWVGMAGADEEPWQVAGEGVLPVLVGGHLGQPLVVAAAVVMEEEVGGIIS